MTAVPQNRTSCFAKLLDVRTYVMAARAACDRAEPAVAIFMLIAFGAVAAMLTPIYITFDLSSTWDFTTGLRDTSEETIESMGNGVNSALGVDAPLVNVQGDLYTPGANPLLDLTLGAALAGVIWTGFTLLPSLFELAFPTVNHPLLNLLLFVAIIFDYVTDWGKADQLTATWTNNGALQWVYTLFVCWFVSVGVQAVLVCCVTIIIYSIKALLRGGAQQVEAVIVNR